MTWQLMWRNVKAAALNATLHLLVIYIDFINTDGELSQKINK